VEKSLGGKGRKVAEKRKGSPFRGAGEVNSLKRNVERRVVRGELDDKGRRGGGKQEERWLLKSAPAIDRTSPQTARNPRGGRYCEGRGGRSQEQIKKRWEETPGRFYKRASPLATQKKEGSPGKDI